MIRVTETLRDAEYEILGVPYFTKRLTIWIFWIIPIFVIEIPTKHP